MRRLRLALVVFAAVALRGADHPNLQRGFAPEKLYQFNGIDSVNLLNGNLTLQIPIGTSYPLDGGNSYSFVLTYNSKLWGFVDVAEERTNDDGSKRTEWVAQAFPTRHSNAGLGWMLSPGRMVTGIDPESIESGPAYEDASGATHYFRGPLHDEPSSSVSHTRDGSYLRLSTASDGRLMVEKGNGERHIFNSQGYLAEVRRADNSIADGLLLYSIAYVFEGTSGLINQWTLTDSYGRSQVVTFRAISANPQYNYNRVVDSVVLTTSSGTATYIFEYDDNVTIARDCRDETTTETIKQSIVPMLKSIKEASTGWSYKFEYNLDYEGCDPGTIRAMTLPTLGRYEWSYGEYWVPGEACVSMEAGARSPGVVQKREYLPAATPSANPVLSGTWQYKNEARWVQAMACTGYPTNRPTTDIYDVSTTTITAPDNSKTKHFFSVWGLPQQSSLGFRKEDHGLPFSGQTDLKSGDFFLSRKTSQCVGEACTDIRSEYVRYEGSAFLEKLPRVSGTRTVFHDDDDKYVQIEHSDFDGYGHYRKSQTSSTFGDGTERTRYTAYNGNAGPNGRAPGQPGLFIPSSQAWLTETFAGSSVKDVRDGVSRTTVESVCFDANGYLVGRRVHAATATVSAGEVITPAATAADVVLFRELDSVRNVSAENWYGGDTATVTITNICQKPAPAASYRLTHTYQYGALASSKWDAMTWKTVDRQNFFGSGLPQSSNDSAGVETTFSYDAFGRTKSIASTSASTISFDYVPAAAPTASAPASGAYVSITQGAGNDVYTVEHHYDGLGRPIAERRRLPGESSAKWAQRRVQYDLLSRKTAESVWTLEGTATSAPLPPVVPTHWTTFAGYDAFGRVGTVDPPGTESTTFTYVGVRETTRTSTVATAQDGSETATDTTEQFDAFGRLVALVDAKDVTTSYVYDAADRLTKVIMDASTTAQEREFFYDNRGFLRRESHPEVGLNGKGFISYPCYDARGHALRRVDGVSIAVTECNPASAANDFDVKYTFDAAERLLTVAASGTGGNLLKEFAYDTPTGPADLSAGKLKIATRHNRIPELVKVEETYLYEDAAGRLTRRVTKVDDVGTSHDVEFQQSYAYDGRSLPSAISYPNCTNDKCGTANSRTMTFTRNRGYLTDIPGITKSPVGDVRGFSYHPSGAVSVARHADGSSDELTPDSGTTRPESIVFAGFSNMPPCPAITLSGPTPAQQTIPYLGGTSISISPSGGQGFTITWYEGPRLNTTVTAGTGATLAVGPLAQSKEYWARVTNSCGSVVDSAVAEVRVQLSAPAALTAEMIANGGIVVSWSAVNGATGYTVERSTNGQPFTVVYTGNTTNTWTDAATSVWTSYLYRVIATRAGTVSSAPSAVDFATRVAFSNPSIAAGEEILGTEIGELRRAVDALRRTAGLAAQWSNYGGEIGIIAATHLAGIRTALEAARSGLQQLYGIPGGNFGEVVTSDLDIRAAHIQTLMDGTR